VQLAWSEAQQTPTACAEVVAKIKEGLLFAMDSAITAREEEVKRFESQRQMPGWNFCTFFILKARSMMYTSLFLQAHVHNTWLPVGEPRKLF
jgi:hypothetical protein